MLGSRRHNIGVTPLETLIDILVHGQDIAIPLDRGLGMPPAIAAVAATRALSMRWPILCTRPGRWQGSGWPPVRRRCHRPHRPLPGMGAFDNRLRHPLMPDAPTASGGSAASHHPKVI
jgi:hypothetical protein